MSIQYARAQSDLNYHKRRALLYAQGVLEEIKCDNRNLGTYGRPFIASSTSTYNLDNSEREVIATVEVTSSTGGNPYAVNGLLQTFRDEVFVTVSWREKKTADLGVSVPSRQSITLQENYFWKQSQVNVTR
jgi:hypothetical protein